MIVFGMSTKLTFEFVENLNCQVFHLFYLGDTYLIIKTPCNSVYIIVYILGIHCTLSYKSCPTEYIPDVFRKWQLCSLNYDRAIDHQPPCKPDSFLFSCCSWSRRRRILLLLLKCCNLKIWKVGVKGEASSLFNPKTKSNWVKKCVMPFPKI